MPHPFASQKGARGDAAFRGNLQTQCRPGPGAHSRLTRRGFVRRLIVRLPPVDPDRAHVAASKRREPRVGIRTSAVGLTKLGHKFIAEVLPNHTKMVKALLRALDAREQDSLSRLCRKLRVGNAVRYFAEFTHEYVYEDDED